MKYILSKELREKAGADSFNRYEYQVGWSVLHMINKYKENEEFSIFCEFHDDMSEINNSSNLQQMNFYQVKTKNKGNFTFRILFNKPAKKKHSFMGYLFYNFYHFGNDCSSCYFIGNKEFDEEIKKWQAVIQDKNDLSIVDPILYKKIEEELKKEFIDENDDLPNKFHSIFKKFIQNTYIITSPMPLESHSNFLQAEFFKAIKFQPIQMHTAHLIFSSIVNEVREKTKNIITTPISFKELKEKKGIDSKVFRDIESSKNRIQTTEISEEIKGFLKDNGVSIVKIKLYLRELKEHYNLFIDISNSDYIHAVQNYKQEIYKNINSNIEIFDDFNELVKFMDKLVQRYLNNNKNPFITKEKLEVLFYEAILSE